MKSKLVAGVLAGALPVCFYVDQARAVTVYTYTGNNFLGIINNTPPDGTYTTSMNVTGSFTLQNALSANLPFSNIIADVLGFSFSDGRNTITNLNATSINGFLIGTNALGNINAWQIILIHNDATYPNVVGAQSRSIGTNNNGVDVGAISECIQVIPLSGCVIQTDQANISQVPGTWSSVTTPSAVPLPAALPLFAGGLGALGLLGWRRKRKAAAVA